MRSQQALRTCPSLNGMSMNLERRMAKPDAKYVPWEEVRARLRSSDPRRPSALPGPTRAVGGSVRRGTRWRRVDRCMGRRAR